METAKQKIYYDLIRTCRGNSDEITLDLIPDVFKRLHVKTLARFLCLSKEYKSIICNRDFMKSYLIKSSTHPQSLIFTFENKCSGMHFFFYASHPRKQGDSSSSSTSLAIYHMKCDFFWNTIVGSTDRSRRYITIAPTVHGLICYGLPSQLMVYNPSTRRSITLPKIDSHRIDMHHFLGYDPIDGDYKVLCMMEDMYTERSYGLAQELWVLTLGKENSWRMIEDFPPRTMLVESSDICINGVLYYGGLFVKDIKNTFVVMSFDVRSEKIVFIEALPEMRYHIKRLKLTNYEGKLALLFSSISDSRIILWVLEDAIKPEWSKKSYMLSAMDGFTYYCRRVFCAANGGELVLAPKKVCGGSFYVLYYDPRKGSVRKVYIEGISEQKLWDEDSYHNMLSVFSGQVIGKMTEDKTTHVPFRYSKLTRLLQSSLSGHGHVSVQLFCIW